MKPNLSWFSFIDLDFAVVYENSLPNTRIQSVFSRVFFRSFIVLYLGLWSTFSIMWSRSTNSSYCQCNSSCPSTIYCKSDSFPLELSWQLVRNQVTINVKVDFSPFPFLWFCSLLILGSQFYSMDLYACFIPVPHYFIVPSHCFNLHFSDEVRYLFKCYFPLGCLTFS